MVGPDELDGYNHEAHGDGREDEAQGQEHTGVGAVAHASHQEFGQGIGRGVQAQHKAQFGFVKAQGCHGWNGHGQVLAHQVKAGIADERADEHLQTQTFELGVGLGAGLGRQIGRLSEEW